MAKVLVVDDHASNRDLITTLLQHAGHAFIEAADGRAALEQVRALQPDLVICDLLMPTMDGYEFVRQLRADPAIVGTRVIFYSATFMEREARALAHSCGVSHVLLKPCEPQDILRTIGQALADEAPAVPDGMRSNDTADFDREHLRLLTDKLALKVSELEGANQRLSALTDLNLQLASERDPYQMLDKVCRGARELLGARCSVLAVRGRSPEESMHLTTWGLPAEQVGLLNQAFLDTGILGQVMSGGQARRFRLAGDGLSQTGLPKGFPTARFGLIAPIVSLNRAYGWILLLDRLGVEAFTQEDERLLAIHAAQAGRIYENGSLYTEIKRTAVQLAQEIGERKRAAEALSRANDTLEQRVKLRTAELHEIIDGLESFNRSVSHDLRGPLGGIAGAAHMARECMARQDNDTADRMLQAIAAQAEITQKLVEALLSLARTSDSQLTLERIDLNTLVAEVVDALRQARAAGRLPVSVVNLGEVEADPELTRQVFVNLIGNALKFTSERASPKVEVGRVDGAADPPVFFVRDNGVGFIATDTDRLFRPFLRLHGARFEGSGVGLSIVKRIVDRHGGRIWAEGAPEQGAVFYFSLGSPAS